MSDDLRMPRRDFWGKINELPTDFRSLLLLAPVSLVVFIICLFRLTPGKEESLVVAMFMILGFASEILAVAVPYLGYTSASIPLYFALLILYRDPFFVSVFVFAVLCVRAVISRQEIQFRLLDFSTSYLSMTIVSFLYWAISGTSDILSWVNLAALAVSLGAYYLLDSLSVIAVNSIFEEEEMDVLSDVRSKLRYMNLGAVPVAIFVASTMMSSRLPWPILFLFPFLWMLRQEMFQATKGTSSGDEKLADIIGNLEKKLELERELKNEMKAKYNQQLAELSAYMEMTEHLGGIKDLDNTLSTIITIIRKIIPCQSCVVFLLQDNVLTARGAVTPFKDKLEMFTLLDLKEEALTRAQEKKAPAVISTVEAADDPRRIFITEKSQMCIPLIIRYELIGYLYVGTVQPGTYNDKTLQQLITLGYFASNSIFMTNLYQSEASEKKRVQTMFEKYVSPDVVKEILSRSSEELGLKGEWKKVTVLFLDIRSFSTMTATYSPKNVVSQLNILWSEMGQIVYEFGGTLLSYIGDALLAVFGAPISQKDDAAKAIKSAIMMQVRMQELRDIWTREGRPAMQIGIGINTGVVIAGDVGFSGHREYTVIGETVNVAARIEKLNKKYSTKIIISETTYEEAGHFFTTKHLGQVTLDATGAPIDLYAVGGLMKTQFLG